MVFCYYDIMIGIDEVGRGCWAGPLLVVAVRQTSQLPKGLADSKQLTKLSRESLVNGISQSGDIGEGWVAPAEIDSNGLTKAMRLGVMRALTAIKATSDETIIMDGPINYCSSTYTNVSCVIDADALHPLVSAASVWAKVVRDQYMAKQAQLYPDYGFDSNVGYGTAKHIKALQDFGLTPLHRLSFKPVRKLHEQH